VKRTFALALCVAAAACAARPPDPPRPAPVRVAPPSVDAKVLEEIALMTVGAPLSLSELAAAKAKIDRGDATIESYVGALLMDPRFSRDVAPSIVLNKKAVDLSEEVPWEILRSITTEAKQRIYYLRKPCTAKEAERVHPWWDRATEVLVCPDAHQPDHLREPKSGWFCGGDNLDAARSPFCGCGPNLMFCARDEDANAELRRALRSETQRTVAHLVANDEPLASIFTVNETVRGKESELFYQRWRVVRGEIAEVPDLSAWKEELAPRPESQRGQHAGVLTTPHMLLFGDTPRARMRNFYDLLWCEAPASQRVSTAQILALGVTDLRDGAGWKQLAAMPVCTSCHARLDYGMQFFAGYPSSFVGLVFTGHAVGHGPLYAKDITDARGEGELTPRAFAELATKQPEFLRCMARDVAEHVFGDAAPEEARAIEAALQKRPTLRSALYEALVRYARRAPRSAHAIEWPSGGAGIVAVGSGDAGSAAPASASVVDTSDGARVAPSAPLRALLERHCGACHREGERAWLKDATFDRARAIAILEAVAFRGMPRDGMRAGDRQRLVRALVAAIWSGAAREEAMRWYAGMRALPVEREDAMLRLIEARAGGRDEDAATWSLLESDRHDVSQLGTPVVLSVTLAALRDCKAAGAADLDACVAKSADLAAVAKSR